MNKNKMYWFLTKVQGKFTTVFLMEDTRQIWSLYIHKKQRKP